ncbi:uncharacterized protein LOC108871982 [Brassica rapa]|uniref:Uncharacterized protein n=2 Tax=Brassica TaxID=3705 RepID=A0A3P5ZIR7_BRACM|nr:uncharacterized protein LOC108871982 [Brassica rapa]CAF2101704.1 unnamed protein product [Brassica napus]CAG7877678.1 unnamed protein product [Brassica rapa]CDY43985.1 BnaA05g25800D [Brassica napus]VDC72691.1 unnamed protein product [Brassica rapa]
MVFSSAAIVAVADVSTNTWQQLSRVPSSEMLNTRQLLEMAYCFPYDHLVRCLWEFLCLSIPDSYETLSSSDDDEDDDDDDDGDK